MVQQITAKVLIGPHVFYDPISVEIENSVSTLTNTAKVVLPNRTFYDGKQIVIGDDNIFQRGDTVTIYLGYDFIETLHFKGVVSKVKPEQPIIVECEDLMWTLKQTNITRYYKSVNLKDLLDDILPSNISFQALDVELGEFKIGKKSGKTKGNSATVAAVLSEIQKTYALDAFFRQDVLYVGFKYWPDIVETFDFYLDNAKYGNVLKNNLHYQRKDDIKIEVTVISMQNDNTKAEITVFWQNNQIVEGVAGVDYDNVTLHVGNNITSTKRLKEAAERMLQRKTFEGLQGTIDAIGSGIMHGDIANVVSPLPDFNGRYLVESVNSKFGDGGFTQKIKFNEQVE